VALDVVDDLSEASRAVDVNRCEAELCRFLADVLREQVISCEAVGTSAFGVARPVDRAPPASLERTRSELRRGEQKDRLPSTADNRVDELRQ